MEHDDARELTAAYALHALDPADERAFEAHLARCAECRATLAGLEEAAAELAYDAGPHGTPPPALRERVLAAVAAERSPKIVPLRPRWALPAATAVAAAAAVAAVALGVWAAVLRGDLADERAARAADERIAAVLVAEDARRVPLADGRGQLVVAPAGEAALVVHGLAAAPEDHLYEAWVIVEGSPRRAGVFDGGDETVVVPLDLPVPEGAVVAVTVERAPGVDAPTGAPVLQTESV